MSNGIIIESGAVDGVLFSTSLLFEKFANWTSIHIGKNLNSRFTLPFKYQCYLSP